MLSSMSPVGEHTREQRWWLTAAAYLVGSLLGGGAIGVLLGALGEVLQPEPATGAVLWAGVALLGLTLDLTGRLPTRHRQVDERWLDTYRGWVYGLGFGVQLGAGLVTIVPRSITYVVLAGAALSGSVIPGAVIGATFGLSRALPLLSTWRIRDAAGQRDHFRRLTRSGPVIDRSVMGAQGVAALAVVVAVLV